MSNNQSFSVLLYLQACSFLRVTVNGGVGLMLLVGWVQYSGVMGSVFWWDGFSILVQYSGGMGSVFWWDGFSILVQYSGGMGSVFWWDGFSIQYSGCGGWIQYSDGKGSVFWWGGFSILVGWIVQAFICLAVNSVLQ